MNSTELLAISLVASLLTHSIVSFFNIYLFFIAIIIFKNNISNSIFVNKKVILFSSIIVLSTILFHIFTKSTSVVIPITDYLYIFTGISIAYYLRKKRFLESFLVYSWKIGLIIWFFYLIFFIPNIVFLINNSLINPLRYFGALSTSMLMLNTLTNGLIYKPLISILFLITFILYYHPNKELQKKLLFFPKIKSIYLKFLSISILTISIPSRSVIIGLISFYIFELIFKIYPKDTKFLIKFISFSIPSAFITFLFLLDRVVNRFPEIILIDRRISVWLESIDYLKSNPINLFFGPGYSQIDELLAGKLGNNNELLDLIKNAFNQFNLTYNQQTLASSNNYDLLGFESDFVNSIIAFGLIPCLVISSFLIYKTLSIIFLRINYETFTYDEIHRTFAKFVFPLLIALFFEDRMPYLIIWTFIFTIIFILPKKTSLKFKNHQFSGIENY